MIPALLCLAAPGWGDEVGTQDSSRAMFDRLWSHATLYDNPEGRFVRKLALSGRLQMDSAWYDADQGEFNDLLWRRLRFGFKSIQRGDWVLHIEGDFDLNEGLGHSYVRLTDAYIGYAPSSQWGAKVLKQSAGFTLDGATSSKNLLTLQRNNLTNNLWFTQEYFSGISVSGTVAARWFYKVGLFSSDPSTEVSFSEGAGFGLFSLGYNFAKTLRLDNALVRIDYVPNREHPESGTRDFSNVLSLVSKWEKRDWGLWTDVSGGTGYFEQSNVWGLSVMPFYDVMPHHQVLLRYTFLSSAADNGLRLGRYEREIVSGRGNRYNELYAGYNLFFYGHKLKWQTGLQYTVMMDDADDGGAYRGWGLTTGLRMSW